MNFWTLMIKKDDVLISAAFKCRKFKNIVSNLYTFLSYRNTIDNNNRLSVFVVLNGPSINDQPLELLTGKDVIFANRGFKHPSYSKIKPKYHVFVDPKILDGTWPTTWFDEIWEKSESTKIVLPLEWKSKPIFKKYVEKVVWYNFSIPFYLLGVSGACFDFAIGQKYKNIYFNGFDGTYLAYELIKSSQTHFYGSDNELEGKTCQQFEVDLYMFSRHLRDLNKFAKYVKKRGIHIVNLTPGGLLDMFDREDFETVIRKQNE